MPLCRNRCSSRVASCSRTALAPAWLCLDPQGASHAEQGHTRAVWGGPGGPGRARTRARELADAPQAEPDIATYGAALASLSISSEWQRVLAALGDMRACPTLACCAAPSARAAPSKDRISFPADSRRGQGRGGEKKVLAHLTIAVDAWHAAAQPLRGGRLRALARQAHRRLLA